MQYRYEAPERCEHMVITLGFLAAFWRSLARFKAAPVCMACSRIASSASSICMQPPHHRGLAGKGVGGGVWGVVGVPRLCRPQEIWALTWARSTVRGCKDDSLCTCHVSAMQ